MALLYTGMDPTHYQTEKKIDHVSFLEIRPRHLDSLQMRVLFEQLSDYTHILFTSRTAVKLFLEGLNFFSLKLQEDQQLIAIGRGTAHEMELRGLMPTLIVDNESHDHLIRELEKCDLSSAYFFLLGSSFARPLLTHFLIQRDVRHQVCDLYETHHVTPNPLPNLQDYSEIVFTSPSSVDSFLKAYGSFPDHLEIKTVGQITQHHLQRKLKN